MGTFTFVLSQVLLTSVTLGALKRTGALQINPGAIQNENLRLVVSKSVVVGETICVWGEELYKNIMSKN